MPALRRFAETRAIIFAAAVVGIVVDDIFFILLPDE